MLGTLYYEEYFHDVSDFRGMFKVDVWEEELELGDLMGWTVYDIMLSRGLEDILKGIGEIYNTNDDVVSAPNINNKAEGRGSKYQGETLVRINTFDLGTCIRTMSGAILAYVVHDLLNFGGRKELRT